ncbi:MAG: head GIN domain-containing protein [Bacteroidota bacterium]
MKTKTLRSVTGILITLLFIASCTAQNYGRIKGNGKVITKTRNVDNFEKIGVSGSFDVDLVKGNEGKIDIKIEENLLPYLITEVKDGKLKIKWKSGTSINTNKGVHLTVYFNDINAVGLSGSGDINSKDLIKSDDFNVAVSGSGDIQLNLDVNNLKTAISGSGDIGLSGKTKVFKAGISGSGDIDAGKLESRNAELKIAGSGDMTVTVTEELYARVSGSGDIEYKGNPKIEDIKVSGSGEISKY